MGEVINITNQKRYSMKKVLAVAVIVIAVATLCWSLEYKAGKKDVALPIDTLFIMKSGLPGECRVTVISAASETDKNRS